MRDFLKKWTQYFFFAGFFSLFINLLHLTFPIYMLAVYDRVLASHSMPTLMTITLGAILALIVMGCLDFLRSRLLVQVGVKMDRTLSPPVLTEMLQDSCRINNRGYTQGLADINTLRNYFAGSAIFAIFDAPWTPLYILLIYFMHPVLGYFALAAAVLLLILGVLQDVLTRKKFSRANAIASEENRFTGAAMRNAEVINSMNMLPGITRHWRTANNESVALQTEANLTAGALSSVTKSFRSAMQVLVFGLGAYLVLQGQSSAGIIIAASIIMRQALSPVEQAMNTWKQTIDARGAYKRLDELIKTTPQQEQMELPAPEGRLAAEAAGLSLNNAPILRNITFSLEPGETMGLIGASGAGKTTLCRLMLGIWPTTAGNVRLDGYDVYSWRQDQLGAHLGYLPQDIELFAATVSENIARMGPVDPEKVVAAAQKAGIHEMVLKLPKGYDTFVGENGVRLSGGQRQRVGIARALYGDPKLVVLDEPNSNLDDAGETALRTSLRHLQEQKVSVVIVTHKPSLIHHADKVLMLKDGQMSMFGPKDEVLSRLSMQSRAQDSQSKAGSGQSGE